jgi:SanA protein
MSPGTSQPHRLRRALVRVLASGALLALACGLGVLGLRWWTDHRYASRVYPLDEAPAAPVAVVFGAGVWPDGRLSDILADRVDTGVDLYQQGKVEVLLFTGDNSHPLYNEPQRMLEHAVGRGVPEEDIVLDYAGRRTYDSCYRARYIFGVERAILVTQAYHLDRALFLADALGIDAVGVASDRRDYRFIVSYWWREVLATPVAWWEARVARPAPIMGEPLPIFPDTQVPDPPWGVGRTQKG